MNLVVLFLSLTLYLTTVSAAYRDLEDFGALKGDSVRVNIAHLGKTSSQVVQEKQEGARICQRIAITNQLTHFEFQCFNVQALGAEALAIYNSASGDELSVTFVDDKGHSLAGTQSMQKRTRDGFCRRAMGLASYVCYAR